MDVAYLLTKSLPRATTTALPKRSERRFVESSGMPLDLTVAGGMWTPSSRAMMHTRGKGTSPNGAGSSAARRMNTCMCCYGKVVPETGYPEAVNRGLMVVASGGRLGIVAPGSGLAGVWRMIPFCKEMFLVCSGSHVPSRCGITTRKMRSRRPQTHRWLRGFLSHIELLARSIRLISERPQLRTWDRVRLTSNPPRQNPEPPDTPRRPSSSSGPCFVDGGPFTARGLPSIVEHTREVVTVDIFSRDRLLRTSCWSTGRSSRL